VDTLSLDVCSSLIKNQTYFVSSGSWHITALRDSDMDLRDHQPLRVWSKSHDEGPIVPKPLLPLESQAEATGSQAFSPIPEWEHF
jgi:hypothetical protein